MLAAYSAIRIRAMPSLSRSSDANSSVSMKVWSNSEGIASAMKARMSSVAFIAAWRRSKVWMPCRSPPRKMARPITSSRLPSTEPMIEARTSSTSPSLRAKMVMISSAALPSVALSSPPMRGPTRAAISSVAWPINPARGMIASAEVAKIATSSPPDARSSTATAPNSSSVFKLTSFLSSNVRPISPRSNS